MRAERLNRLLVLVSAAWLGVLLSSPSLHGSLSAFCFTLVLIASNLLVSAGVLLRLGKVLVLVNLAQLGLFCSLNYQLFTTFGREHYRFDTDPSAGDWVQLTAVHVLRAVDVPDILTEYGVEFRSVQHASTASGVALVTMHWVVDIFLVGLAASWLVRLWNKPPGDKRKAEERRAMRGALQRLALCICVLLFLGWAIVQGWRREDWFLWPVDNILRTADIGDMFQIFHWRLHAVAPGLGIATVAVCFRLLVGLYLAEGLYYLVMTKLEGVGLPLPRRIEGLSDGDAAVRRAAAEALGRMGPAAVPAVPALSQALADEAFRVRVAAAEALGLIGPEAGAAVPALAQALADPAADVRNAAAQAIEHIDTDWTQGEAALRAVPGVVYAWARGILEDDAHVRHAGATVMRRLGPACRRCEPAVPALAKALAQTSDHTDSRVSDAIEEVLAAIGLEAEALVAALARALVTDSDPKARGGAARVLGLLSPVSAVAALAQALTESDAGVRQAAAEALGKIGPEAVGAVRALAGALSDSEEPVRREAADALGQIGPAAQAAVPALARALTDGDAWVRQRAAEALGRIGPSSGSAVPALAKALADKDYAVRSNAAEALGQIGPSAGAAVEALAKALTDEESGVRSNAAAALGQIGQTAHLAAPALVQALADDEKWVRHAAVAALGQIDPAGKATLPALARALLTDKEESVRQQAAAVVGGFAPTTKAAVPVLAKALGDADSSVRSTAAAALGKLGPDAGPVVPQLVGALADKAWWVRSVVAGALGRIGPAARAAVPALVQMLADDIPSLRRDAAEALGHIGPEAKAAVPALIQMLADGERLVTDSADFVIELEFDDPESAAEGTDLGVVTDKPLDIADVIRKIDPDALGAWTENPRVPR